MKEYWRAALGNIDVRLLDLTPETLYEKVKEQGYDWDILLNTRPWYSADDDDHCQLELSTLDIMRIALGTYHPFWLEADKKTIKKKYRKEFVKSITEMIEESSKIKEIKMTELNNTNEEQVIELTKETAQEINDEYAKMAGEEPVKVEDTLNKTGLKDETFEALITDPNFILSDLKKLIDKHGLFTLTDLFNFMGFNINTLKAVIYNKSITEQIFLLSRELRLFLYRIGELSGKKEEGYNTREIRSLLGETMTSKEWLELLDTQILPYIGYYVEHGKIDREWFTREENKIESQEEATAAVVREAFETNRKLANEMMQMNEEIKVLFDEDGNVREGKDTDNLQLEHGEETVLETNNEEVKEAQEHLDHAGETVVEEEPVQEQTQQ